MKKLLLLLLVTTTCFAQREFDYATTALSTPLIAPTIDALKERTTLIGSKDAFSGYMNKPFSTTDDFTLGLGFNYHKNNGNFRNIEGYVARSGSNGADKLRMALIFGYYEVYNRDATYGGLSFSYHPTELTYFGLTIRDLYDVSTEDGKGGWTELNSKVFFLYEAMTPSLYANVAVWDNNFESLQLYGDIAYNDKQKTTYTLAANYVAETHRVGAFYNGHLGMLAQQNFDWIDVYVSGTISQTVNLGVIINNLP